MQCKKNFENFFDKPQINRIAKSSGFTQRKAKKISPFHFVLGFILCCSKRHNTFSEWALQIGLLTKQHLSRQGVFDRISARAERFSRQLLQDYFLRNKYTNAARSKGLFTRFGKVLLQDSTTLQLPQYLADLFPGSVVNGVQKAIARVQAVIDLKSMQFVDFKLGAYTQNDQSASHDILTVAHKGDLVIRDMGYFTTAVFEAMIRREVFFLSRLRYGVMLFDKQGKAIDLKRLLKKNKVIDQWVFVGDKRKVWVRLIMLPLNAHLAAERIRKARNHPDKRFTYSNAYYQWLRYSSFITTVDKNIWTAREVTKVYKLRWQIEIIFKSWKSGFSIKTLLHERCTDENRVKVCIYLMLLFICLFMQKLYVPYNDEIQKVTGKTISLLKLSHFISGNIIEFFAISTAFIKKQITQHCCYDKRSSRVNLTDLLHSFKN